jgi:hypothetical protein
MSPSIFAVQTIPETFATTVRTRSGSPHNQSEIQDDPTTRLASSMRRQRGLNSDGRIRSVARID